MQDPFDLNMDGQVNGIDFLILEELMKEQEEEKEDDDE